MRQSIRSSIWSSEYHRSDVLKTLIVISATLLITLGLLSRGQTNLSVSQTLHALQGLGDPISQLVVNELRAPRLLLGFLAGGSLAIAGLLLQTLTRVSLASPSLLGTVDASGLAVAGFLWFSSSVTAPLVSSNFAIPIAGFVGAIGSLLILRRLTGATPSTTTIVLVGIVLSALAKALTTFVMIKGPTYVTSQVQLWLVGSVGEANWDDIHVMLPIILVLMGATLLSSRQLKLANLSDASTASMGIQPNTLRISLGLLAAGLTAVAVSFVGGLGFVGLVVPHLCKQFIHSLGRLMVINVFCTGGVLVMLADSIGRSCFTPYEVPAGVITACVGVPVFIYLFVIKERV